MRYVSKTTEVEAMRWEGGEPFADDTHPAREIVAWVSANDGEARYESAGLHRHSILTVDVAKPRIAVRTINGWAYAAPGHYVVMGSATFVVACEECGSVATQHKLHCLSRPKTRRRDFYPVDLETFERRWSPAP